MLMLLTQDQNENATNDEATCHVKPWQPDGHRGHASEVHTVQARLALGVSGVDEDEYWCDNDR